MKDLWLHASETCFRLFWHDAGPATRRAPPKARRRRDLDQWPDGRALAPVIAAQARVQPPGGVCPPVALDHLSLRPAAVALRTGDNMLDGRPGDPDLPRDGRRLEAGLHDRLEPKIAASVQEAVATVMRGEIGTLEAEISQLKTLVAWRPVATQEMVSPKAWQAMFEGLNTRLEAVETAIKVRADTTSPVGGAHGERAVSGLARLSVRSERAHGESLMDGQGEPVTKAGLRAELAALKGRLNWRLVLVFV